MKRILFLASLFLVVSSCGGRTIDGINHATLRQFKTKASCKILDGPYYPVWEECLWTVGIKRKVYSHKDRMNFQSDINADLVNAKIEVIDDEEY